MKRNLSRRTFFGASLAGAAASTALASSSRLVSLITGPSADAQVFNILQRRFGLGEEHRQVVDAFTHSLRTSSRHHETAANFELKLRGVVAQGELLEIYVLQEFVISTNYTAFAKGVTNRLELRTTPFLSVPRTSVV